MSDRPAGEGEHPRQPNDPSLGPEPARSDGGLRPGDTRLELRGISKSFGGVRVLSDVDFRLAVGEVVAIDDVNAR